MTTAQRFPERLHVVISAAQMRALRKEAKKLEASLGDLTREALSQFLADREEPAPTSHGGHQK